VNPFIDEVGGRCQDKYQDSHAVKVGFGVPPARIVNEGRTGCDVSRLASGRQNRFVASFFRFNLRAGACLINAIDFSFAEGDFRAARYTSRLYIRQMLNLASISAPTFSEKVCEYF
jgi:hypothetical protein